MQWTLDTQFDEITDQICMQYMGFRLQTQLSDGTTYETLYGRRFSEPEVPVTEIPDLVFVEKVNNRITLFMNYTMNDWGMLQWRYQTENRNIKTKFRLSLIGNGNEIAYDEFDVSFIGPAPTTNDCENAEVRILRGAQPEPLVYTSTDLFKRKEVDEAIVVSVQDASGKDLPECRPTFELRVLNPILPTPDFTPWDRLGDSLQASLGYELNSRAFLEGTRFNFRMSAEELETVGTTFA